MHELSLAASLIECIEKVAKENGLSSVKEVHLEVGEMTHVDPRQLKFCLKVVSQNTVAEESRIYIKRKGPVIRCKGCGLVSRLKRSKELAGFSMSCPSCGSDEVELEEGRELLLKRIKGVKSRKVEDPSLH
ncbi:MAG: hydrogenase maturation nickel metallochaperone HypA [Candidatus Verstraetearchaeota archaeon]|nr:hydrogenase maturation nickel metallochaperone HypA [Candidatus Verstraetearchaeota archaeon]